LTQEEARMASAELLKITHSVDDRVKGVEEKVQDVRSDVQEVHGDVQGIRGDMQDARGDVQDVGNKVQGVDDRMQGIGNEVRDKLDQVNRSYIFNTCSSLRGLRQLRREPDQG
jgi:uncharacterized protein YoxC